MVDALDIIITVITVSAGIITTVAYKSNRKLGHGIILGGIATGGLMMLKGNGNGSQSTGIQAADDTVAEITKKLNELTDNIQNLSVPALSTSMVKTH